MYKRIVWVVEGEDSTGKSTQPEGTGASHGSKKRDLVAKIYPLWAVGAEGRDRDMRLLGLQFLRRDRTGHSKARGCESGHTSPLLSPVSIGLSAAWDL